MIWIKQKDDWDIGNLMSFISKMKIIKKKGFRRIMFNINTSLSPTAAWELLKRNIKDYSINFANVHQSTN